MSKIFQSMKPLPGNLSGEPDEVAAKRTQWAEGYLKGIVTQQNLETRLTEQLNLAQAKGMEAVRKKSGVSIEDKNYSKISGEDEARIFTDTVSSTLTGWYAGDVLGLGKVDKKFDELVLRALRGDIGFRYNQTLASAVNTTMTPDTFTRQFANNWRGTFGRTLQEEAVTALGTIEARQALSSTLGGSLPAGVTYKDPKALQADELYSDAINFTLQGPDSYIESNPDRFTTSTGR
jgi:hypothetical protein